MATDSFFKFRISTNLRFGVGTSEQLTEEINELGYRKIAAIIDKGVFSHPQVKKSLDRAKEKSFYLDVYKNEAIEPTYDDLESFKQELVGKDYDCLVGIGGGSTLDLAKGMAILLTNKGNAISFRGFPELRNSPLPVIAIPTTAGTGSEVTYNAVFTDAKEKKKLGINSILNFPVCAIIDPLLTVNCPKEVTVSSGCDALVHTLESYVHKNNTLISRMYSKQAFHLLYNGLTKVLDEPSNVAIRADLALGAYFAGIALINAGSGPSGAFSYPLGAVYKIPHGYAGAMFLSSITRLNVKKGYRDYSELYDLIKGSDKALSIEQKNIKFADYIQKLMDKLDVPRYLSYYNLGPKDINFIIEQYDTLKLAIDQNPMKITKDDAKEIMYRLT